MLKKRLKRIKTITRNLFRFWLLCLCEDILGDEITPEEEKLLSQAYNKLLEDDRKIEERR